MTDIAKLAYSVDSSQMASATRALDKNTRAAGKTATATEKLEREAQQLERQAHKLGKVWGTMLGVISAGALIKTFNSVIEATIEQERVIRQLEQRLVSTKGASGLMRDELVKMAGALQGVTTYGDEAIIGAENLLLTFTRIGRDVFPDALETVLDMSTAMGTDLKSSAIQLGKALNDPIEGVTALSRVGVQFSESQRKVIEEMVKTNQIAKAQELILGELETQMGGSARAARDTLGGSIQALKNAFGDLLEGDSGGDGVRGTTKAINDLTETLSSQQTKDSFAALANGIVGISGALIESINWWNKWGEARRIAMNDGGLAGASESGAQKRLDEIADTLANRAGMRAGTGTPWERLQVLLTDFELDSDEELMAERDRIIAQLAGRNRDGAIDKMVRDAMGESIATRKGAGGGAFDPDASDTATAKILKQAEATDKLSEAQKALIEQEKDWAAIQGVWDQGAIDASNRRTETIVEGWEREAEAAERATQKMMQDSERASRMIGDMFGMFLFDTLDQGFEGALDNFSRMLQRMAIEALSAEVQNWAKGLMQGTGQGGSGTTNWLTAAMSALGYGGGRAYGGDVRGGRIYRMGEGDRPELLNLGRGRQYVIPGDSGRVEPIRADGGAPGMVNNISISVEGQVDMRSRSRIASDIGREMANARRNS